jgi:ubiquinone/menaquinone biosynthesis C-methylase UbiE
MIRIRRPEVIMPGGIELTLEAERRLDIHPDNRLLSVACGTGELELYLAEKYGCSIEAIDIGEWAITRAREKVASRGLEHLVRFEIGDGNSLKFGAAVFDVVFCSGALGAFYDSGLKEFHRVLVPGGRAAIIEVIWRTERVPSSIQQRWTEGSAAILTIGGNHQAFEKQGFRVLFSKAYHEPSWWEAYYDDRGDATHWQEERASYRAHQDYLGLGVFILEKREPMTTECAADSRRSGGDQRLP